MRHVILPLLVLSACSRPNLGHVTAEFEQLHPGCRVESVLPGEGDSDHVYVHIAYRCSSGGRSETKWLYRRFGREWRHTPPVVKTDAVPPLRMSAGIVAPVVITRVDPRFPDAETKRQRRAGILLFEGVVTTEGHYRDVRIIGGENGPLAPYVLDAVKQWQFRPALKEGRPVDLIYNVSANIHVR
jgi:hypothetical protein